jgi:spermidine synthase
VLIIRRALALSGGDESVLAAGLAIWLICTAAGSIAGGFLFKHTVKSRPPLATLLIVLSVCVLFSPISTVYVTGQLSWLAGTVPGVGGMVLPLLISMLPIGLCGGALFPVSCRALRDSEKDSVRTVYLLEALGAFTGGIITAIVFAPHVGGLVLALFFAGLGFGSALSLIIKRITVWITLILAVAAALFLSPLARHLEILLFEGLHPGMALRDLLETPYGLLEVTDRAGQLTVYENGLLLATSDDFASDEEKAHIPLAQHPSPQRILWIGGYPGGGKEQALKHPSVAHFDIVELNPILFTSERMLGNKADTTGRIRTHRGDGRIYLAGDSDHRYDVIQLNLPGPQSARLAKYYTVEAFEIMRGALNPGGILCFSIQSAEDYIGSDLAELLSSLYQTCRAVFDSVFVLPGANAVFITGNGLVDPALTADMIQARLAERGIEPLYWDYYRVRNRLLPERYSSLQKMLQAHPGAEINRDRRPISFYFQEVFKSQEQRGGSSVLLKKARSVFLPITIAVLCLVIVAAAGIRFFSRRNVDTAGAGLAVFCVGFSGISLEILTLVAFQVYYGSGYRLLGLMTGCYMVGLAVGAYISVHFLQKYRTAFRGVQLLWVVLPLGLVALSMLFSANQTIAPLIGGLLFFMYLLVIGITGGLHFPLAVKYSGESSPFKGGIYYGIDLAGSAGSALILALFALPLIGIWNSCFLLLIMNAIPLMLLIRGKTA